MDWNDFEKDTTWIDRFSYYLDPENSSKVNSNDLLGALAMAVAMYCDEYQNACYLEDKIAEAFGEEALAKILEDDIPEDDVLRFVAVGEAPTSKARAKLVLGYLKDLKEENREGTD